MVSESPGYQDDQKENNLSCLCIDDLLSYSIISAVFRLGKLLVGFAHLQDTLLHIVVYSVQNRVLIEHKLIDLLEQLH